MSANGSPMYEFAYWRRLANSRNVPLTGAAITKVTVRAADEATAREKVATVSGQPPDPVMSHRTWHFDLRSISEVQS